MHPYRYLILVTSDLTQCRVWDVVLCGVSGSTWVVMGPKTWDAAGECNDNHRQRPGDVRDSCLTMTDGLVAIGDCVVQLKSGKGLVTSSGSTPRKDLRWPQYPTESNFRICGQLVPHSLGTRPLSLGYHIQGSSFEVSKFQTKPGHGTVAEVLDDRVLLANPGNEAKLVSNPAWLESVAHDVFAKLWSAIRQFEIVGKNVPLFWFSRNQQTSTQQSTLAGQQWPVVSANRTAAGTNRSCNTRCVDDDQRTLLSTAITSDGLRDISRPPPGGFTPPDFQSTPLQFKKKKYPHFGGVINYWAIVCYRHGIHVQKCHGASPASLLAC